MPPTVVSGGIWLTEEHSSRCLRHRNPIKVGVRVAEEQFCNPSQISQKKHRQRLECTKTGRNVGCGTGFISVLKKALIWGGILISKCKKKLNFLLCQGRGKKSPVVLSAPWRRWNWAVWWLQMSFALRRQKIIVLCRCYRKKWEMGFFSSSSSRGVWGWMGFFFSATPHWW